MAQETFAFNNSLKEISKMKIDEWINKILQNLSSTMKQNIAQNFINFQITTVKDLINLGETKIDNQINKIHIECKLDDNDDNDNNSILDQIQTEINKLINQFKIIKTK